MNASSPRTRPAALRVCLAILVSAVAATFAGNAAAAKKLTPVVTHTFDADAQEWTVLGEAKGPNFQVAEDRHAGYISANDPQGTTGTSYWQAGPTVLKFMTGAFNGKISYEVRSVGDGPVFKDADIVIEGGGNVLVYRNKKKLKGTRWTKFKVTLNGGRGWKDGNTGRKASKALMQAALGSIDSVLIRGEFRNGPEAFDLDNFVLSTKPVL